MYLAKDNSNGSQFTFVRDLLAARVFKRKDDVLKTAKKLAKFGLSIKVINDDNEVIWNK